MSKIGHNIAKITQRTTRSGSKLLATVFLTSAIGLCVQGTALAQTKTDDTALKTVMPASDGLTLNMTQSQMIEFDSSNFVNLSPSLQGAVIDIPSQSVGSRLFNLDMANINCLTGEEGCSQRSETLDLGYTKSITTKLDGKLDIQLTPRASVSFNDETSSAVVGAIVRIGDDLREDADLKANTWYMFAGADAEAVTYSPNSMRRITNGNFGLQDRIIVGDAQAGVGYRIGEADLSLGYFRREVTSFGREIDSGGITFKEDAAALSFTWRR